MNPTIPPWLQDALDNPPMAGGGLNTWLFTISRQLHAHFTPEKIQEILTAKTQGGILGRTVAMGEITRAINRSAECAWTPTGGDHSAQAHALPVGERESKWAPFNADLRHEIIERGAFRLADLWDESPVKVESPESPPCEWFIDALFPGNPFLCVGDSMSVFETWKKEDLRGTFSRRGLIVPSPMSRRKGLTQEGHLSEHSLDNTGPRKYLVIEFDEPRPFAETCDGQAAIVSHLSTLAPLVMAVYSGKKSLHSWFNVAGEPDELVTCLMRYAVTLGADKATFTRSQFVRMPQGTRDNGARQLVNYFNPSMIFQND